MKLTDSAIREQLYLYAEARLGRADALSPEEREAIEARLNNDSTMRDEAQRIQEHLRFLRDAPQPLPAADLAARCLSHAQDYQARRPRGFWLPAYAAAALVLVFMSGLYLGGALTRSTQGDPFQALMAHQDRLVQEIQIMLVERGGGDATWAAHLATISETSRIIADQFEAYRGDPIIEQRLNSVLYNNILLLESLHQDLESGDSLTERQMLQVKPNASRTI